MEFLPKRAVEARRGGERERGGEGGIQNRGEATQKPPPWAKVWSPCRARTMRRAKSTLNVQPSNRQLLTAIAGPY
jgi:hypothetical protein